jgi:hypothetical protein
MTNGNENDKQANSGFKDGPHEMKTDFRACLFF